MALTDRASLLASRVAAEVKSLWAAVESKADADHNHDGVYAKPADLPDVSDVIREGDSRLTDDRDPTAHDHDDRYYTEAEVDSALSGKAPASHTHADYVLTTDARLSNARTPTAHNHAVSDVTGLQDELDGKSDSGHDHDGTYQPVGDYAAGTHTHSQYVETTDPRLTDARTPTAHDHTIGDVTGLQSALDGKSDSGHTHTPAQVGVSNATSSVTGLVRLTGDLGGTATSPTVRSASTTVAGKVELATVTEATTGTDTARAVTPAGLKAVADGKAASSHTHDDRYYTEAEVDSALSGKANTSHTHAEYAPATQTINAQTGTTYTLATSDAGKVVTATNASPVTITVRASRFEAGQRIDVLQRGAGSVTFAAGSGMTLHGTPSLVTRDQWSAASVLFLSTTEAVVIGDLATP